MDTLPETNFSETVPVLEFEKAGKLVFITFFPEDLKDEKGNPDLNRFDFWVESLSHRIGGYLDANIDAEFECNSDTATRLASYFSVMTYLNSIGEVERLGFYKNQEEYNNYRKSAQMLLALVARILQFTPQPDNSLLHHTSL